MIYHFSILCEWIPEHHKAMGHIILKPYNSCRILAVIALRKSLDYFERYCSIGFLIGNQISDAWFIVFIENMLKVFERNKVSSFLIIYWFSFLRVTMKIKGDFIWYWWLVTNRDELSSEEEHRDTTNNISQVHRWSKLLIKEI